MNFEITVVFPYYNEEQSLDKTLELISRQTYLPKEVIFVNSSSTDGSSALIDKWIREHQENDGIQYRNIYENTDTPSSSKNVGIRHAQTEWLAFMDCGLLFPEDWLELQVSYIKRSGVELVSGVCDLNGINIIDNCCLAQTYGYHRKRPVVPSTLVKKCVFEKTGLFLEGRRSGYDHAWQIYIRKFGIKRGVNSEVVICYNGVSFADSFSAMFKKMIKYSKPAIAIPDYFTPYLYMSIAILLGVSLILEPNIIIVLLPAYIFTRLLLIPIIKSRGTAIYREHPLSILFMFPVGVVMDIGRLIGNIQGFYFYHLGGHRKIQNKMES